MSTATKLIVLTNLHNPSSANIEPESMRAIGRLAKAAGARVLVDEVYLDAAFDASPPSLPARSARSSSSPTRSPRFTG